MDPRTLAACRSLMQRDRLRIIGALAGADATAGELADALGMPRRAVTRHLGQLRFVGLIRTRDGEERAEAVNVLAVDRLAAIAADIARFEASQAPATTDLPSPDAASGQPGWSVADTRTLQAFVVGGRLTSIPAQRSKRQVVLRFLAETAFAADESYPEKDVNMRLALRHPDVASLRRYLVDEGFMERAAGVYRIRAHHPAEGDAVPER